MRKRYAAGILVGGICLYLAVRKVEWARVGEAFAGADYALIPAFAAAHLVGVMIRIARWRLILSPFRKASTRNLLSALSVGFMANFLFPARVGEVVRAYLIGRREGISKTASFATVVLERLFDGFAILLFLALSPFFLRVPEGSVMRGIRLAGVTALAAYASILGILLLFHRRQEAFLGMVERIGRPLPAALGLRVRNLLCSFGRGLDMLGSPAHILGAAAWSVFLWGILGIGNWAVLSAFDIRLPVFAGLFLVVVQSFGTMVPSPGFVGAFQYVHVLGLSLFGVGRETALSVGILINALLFVIYIGLGLVFLWVEGMRLGDVAAAPAGEDF